MQHSLQAHSDIVCALQAAQKLKCAQTQSADAMWAYTANPAPGALPRSPELLARSPGTSSAANAAGGPAVKDARRGASRDVGTVAAGGSPRPRSPVKSQGTAGEDALRLMRQPHMRPHLAAEPEVDKLDDNSRFRPKPEREHDEQLFRGAAARLPGGHSQAVPRATIHAGDRRCAFTSL